MSPKILLTVVLGFLAFVCLILSVTKDIAAVISSEAVQDIERAKLFALYSMIFLLILIVFK